MFNTDRSNVALADAANRNPGQGDSSPPEGHIVRRNGLVDNARTPLRETIQFTCPGSRLNGVHIGWSFGVGNPANVGSCPLFMCGIDADSCPCQRKRGQASGPR